jgi:hypothetical protein
MVLSSTKLGGPATSNGNLTTECRILRVCHATFFSHKVTIYQLDLKARVGFDPDPDGSSFGNDLAKTYQLERVDCQMGRR